MSGVGIAYRPEFESYLLELAEWVDAFEIVSDNYLNNLDSEELEKLSQLKPIIAHSVSLSVGAINTPKEARLLKMKNLVEKCKLEYLSDHLSYSEAKEIQINNFINLPFTEEMLEIVAKNIRYVQEITGTKFLFENIVYFISWPFNQFTESEFITKLLEKADCGLLLDISNLYVNSINHNYCPYAFIDSIPKDRVGYYHVGGFEEINGVLVDSHDTNIDSRVWELVEYALSKTNGNFLIIERDNDSTYKEELFEELSKAREIWKKIKL